MAQRLVNSYSPQTPIGAGLSNIALALFGGRSPRDQAKDAAQTQAYQAHARLYEAQAQKAETESRNAQAAAAGRQNYLGNLYESLVPETDANAARNYITNTPVLAFEGGKQPRPESLTPDVETQLRRGHVLAPLVTAGSTTQKADDLAKALGLLQDQEFADRTARGDMSPTRFFQLGGKAPFAVQGDTLVNVAEGLLGRTTDLGEARIGTQWSTQRRNEAAADASRAAAGANSALARQRDARLGQITQGFNLPLEPVQGEGSPELVTRPQAVGRVPVAKPKAGGGSTAASRPRPLPAAQMKLIAGAIEAEEEEGGEFDQETRRVITSRATQLAQDPASDLFGDGAGAVQQAIYELGDMTGGKGIPLVPFTGGPRRPKTKPTAAGRVQRNNTPLQSPASPAPPSSGDLPPAARARLKEGVVTKFGNGQQWTLQNGRPVRID